MTEWLIAILIIIVAFFLLRRRDAATLKPDAELSEQDILDEFRAGRKINAIKYYRQLHKVGLKEAKEAVERMDDARD
jgi:ribosomal protein L7/L12